MNSSLNNMDSSVNSPNLSLIKYIKNTARCMTERNAAKLGCLTNQNSLIQCALGSARDEIKHFKERWYTNSSLNTRTRQ